MKLTEKQYKQFLGNQIESQNKYRNKKTTYDEITFDSKKEANHYLALKEMEKLGIIKDLQLQVKFELQPSFKIKNETIRAINYYADFTYVENNKIIVEDVKSEATRKDKVYILKKKMLLYKYKNIEFKEV